MIPTVATMIPTTARRLGRSFKKRALSGIVQKVDVHCKKMALAAVVAFIAPEVEPGHGSEGHSQGEHQGSYAPARTGDERQEHQSREESAIEGDRESVQCHGLGENAAQAPEQRRTKDITPPLGRGRHTASDL